MLHVVTDGAIEALFSREFDVEAALSGRAAATERPAEPYEPNDESTKEENGVTA